MKTLRDLPNISKVIEGNLQKAGVDTPEQLCALGSCEAFARIRSRADSTACLSQLYALEGAIQGTRWHNLGDGVKKALKDFYTAHGSRA